MAMRYFKATDGKITVFRASKTRIYKSASFITRDNDGAFGTRAITISFSAKHGSYPTEEIVKSEYETLVARKNQRIKARGGDPKYANPQDSWVRNAALDH